MFEEIIDLFYQSKNEEQAIKMAKYMKNNFLFLGIQKPVRTKLQKDFLKNLRQKKTVDWDFVALAWKLPEREFQYLALDYLLLIKRHINKEDIDRLEFVITNKSWWDTVDIIADNLIGTVCVKYPDLIDSHILRWAESDNLWLRRTAILFQKKYKENTDTSLLARIILKNNNSQEFFINKAIGWALREYSKTNKEWVEDFIGNNYLHPLSVREGSKYL